MNTNIIFLFLILAISLFVLSCNRNAISNPAYTLNEPVIAERTPDGDYKLFFKDKEVWEVSYAKKPGKIDWDKPSSSFTGDFVEFNDIGGGDRMYFGVTAREKGKRYVVTERIVPMKGMNNFRDIGGLPTADGRVVRWGHIFRSGNLSELTNDDLSYMSKLGIKTVVDFRNDLEVVKDQDRLPAGVDYRHFPIIDRDGSQYTRIQKEVRSGLLRKQKAKKFFTFVMVQFADSVAVNFKPVLDIMLEEPSDIPLLYHCTGGKDRTGVMSIIILGALGVEKKVIRNEYLMSNFYRYEANRKRARRVSLVGIDAETASYAFVVQDEYFDAVFDVIENKYGGMDSYLKTKFDLDSTDLEVLRNRYTTEVMTINKMDMDAEKLPESTKVGEKPFSEKEEKGSKKEKKEKVKVKVKEENEEEEN